MSDERFYRLRRLSARWWLFLCAVCVPWVVLANLGQVLALPSMPLFIVGLCLFFVVLKAFSGYKKALWAMQHCDAQGEDGRWQLLASQQLKGLLLASAPAWWAAVASPFGLDGPAGLLLVLGSLITLWIFRVPAQVLLP